jgi:hypothetical protein
MFRNNREMDRPTFNTLELICQVRGHPIKDTTQLTDPYVEEFLRKHIPREVFDEFYDYTRSFYTTEGHYARLWKFDLPIFPMPEDPRIYRAIELTRKAFKLDSPAVAYAWTNLASVPFQSSTAAGWVSETQRKVIQVFIAKPSDAPLVA